MLTGDFTITMTICSRLDLSKNKSGSSKPGGGGGGGAGGGSSSGGTGAGSSIREIIMPFWFPIM